MSSTLQLFLENDQAIKSAFKWENKLMKTYGALQCAIKQKSINISSVKKMKENIKNQTTIFSYFRGNTLFALSLDLSLHGIEKQISKHTTSYYKKLKEEGFLRSRNLPFVANFLSTELNEEDVEQTMKRALLIYYQMKDDHLFLTREIDHLKAIMIAHCRTDIEQITIEMRECYHYLHKNGVTKGETLQTMSQLLTLSTEPVGIKCDRMLRYEKLFKERKIKLDVNTLSLLSILALIDKNEEMIVEQVILTSKELSTHSGFGDLSLGECNRNMFSIAIVCSDYFQTSSQFKISTAVLFNIQNILQFQKLNKSYCFYLAILCITSLVNFV